MEGKIVVLSSPSGGGKTTIIKELVKKIPRSVRFVTTTTRSKRAGEKEGIDYHFITKEEFESKTKQGDFVEHNLYSGNYYGTEKAKLEESVKNYDFVFLPTEVNGKKNLDKAGIKHISIFLLPESLDVLRERILERGSIKPEQIDDRLEIARDEVKQAVIYDFRVINRQGELEETVENIEKILEHLTS